MSTLTVRYDAAIERALTRLERKLQGTYPIARRGMGLFLLAQDEEIQRLVMEQDPLAMGDVEAIVAEVQQSHSRPMGYVLAMQRQEAVWRLTPSLLRQRSAARSTWLDHLSQAMMNPITGVPILIVVLIALYLLVGVLGAQTMVNWLEGVLFGEWINPSIDRLLSTTIPWPVLRGLIGGEYGVLTLGVRYAVAIILPIVGTFFLAFAIIEDSGYLPRLAMLIDRVFKAIGLNGRAVIPMVLGFGCDTMATIVTRTLESRRERVITTLLLALAVPCSAQLGVILAILSDRPVALALWAAIVLGIFLLVGFLTARLIPGERAAFFMELPPLRVPHLSNVLVKTYTRMEWYFREVFPLFILASIVIWIGQITGLLQAGVAALEPVMRLLGLPEQAAVAFLFGFFRRDYGAAGLYDLRSTMTGLQLAVAAVTLTLFVPCIAQFSVMLKERGWKMAMAAIVFIFPFAFFVGWLMNTILVMLRVSL